MEERAAYEATIARLQAELEATRVQGNSLWQANLRLISERDAATAALDRIKAEAARKGYELGREDAANVDWSKGREGKDIGPDCLTDWQRGLVTGLHEMREAIRAISPPADLLERLGEN